jgi:hypothetical protein
MAATDMLVYLYCHLEDRTQGKWSLIEQRNFIRFTLFVLSILLFISKMKAAESAPFFSALIFEDH